MVHGTAGWQPNRKIGVEIEGVGVDAQVVDTLAEAHGWTYTHDPSVYDDRPPHHYPTSADSRTFEAVSPPLPPSQRIQAPRMLERLRALGMRVNDSCGLHVHVDAEALSTDALLHLLGNWYHHEAAIHGMLGLRSIRLGYYTRGFPAQMMHAIAERRPADRAALRQAWQLACQGLQDHPEPVYGDMKLGEQERYWGLNYSALDRHGTVEFRAFEATTEPRRLQAYITLADSLVEHAAQAGPFTHWALFTQRRAPADAADALLRRLGLSAEDHAHFMTMSAQTVWALEQAYRLPHGIRELLAEPDSVVGALSEQDLMDAAHRTAEACLGGAQHLDLSGLSLTSLPPGLGQVPHLQTVDLRHNLLPRPPGAHGHLHLNLGHNTRMRDLAEGLQSWATRRPIFRRRRMGLARRFYTCVSKQQDTVCLVGREMPPFLGYLGHVRYLTIGSNPGEDRWVSGLPQAGALSLRCIDDPPFASPAETGVGVGVSVSVDVEEIE